ncbi:MAG: hypothetical protein NTV07_06620 [Candidatus Omnitrophica bacterium]|nr:hypothetical protein [Candidatus Omnitrophota bacterium]
MLNREQIEALIKERALVSGFIDLTTQLTPNGFDLTAAQICEFDEEGAVDFSNKERKVPAGKAIPAEKKNPDDKFGWWVLKRGAYKVLASLLRGQRFYAWACSPRTAYGTRASAEEASLSWWWKTRTAYGSNKTQGLCSSCSSL